MKAGQLVSPASTKLANPASHQGSLQVVYNLVAWGYGALARYQRSVERQAICVEQ